MIVQDNIAQIHARFREDRAERQLYGADVVDAYLDLHTMQAYVCRRLPQWSWVRVRQIAYRMLALADRGGLHGHVSA